MVYNYGTFNFDEPGFYTKFIRGKLLYYLSTEDFASFRDSYKEEQRSMIEQVLNLNCSEKLKMVGFLYKNLQPENKYYKYDFLFDNCTTRLRDLLEKVADSTIYFQHVVKPKTSFRELIHVYLNRNDKQWSKFGIDLLLGSKTDAFMNNREVMFLPDYLMKSFDSSKIGRKPIVSSKEEVYNLSVLEVTTHFLTSPLFIFSLLLIIIIPLSFSKNTTVYRILVSFDSFLFFMTGIAGILIFFMWFGTEHVMCRNNYNIIWALPTHAITAFFIHGQRAWVKKYFLFAAIADIALLFLWFFLPQELNTAFIPIILLLIYRGLSFYYSLNRYNGKPIRTI